MCPICATAIPDERYLSSAIVVINGKTKVSTNRRENLIYELLKHVESSLFKHKCFFQHQMQFLMGLLNDSSLINIPSMNQCYFNGIRLSMPSIFFFFVNPRRENPSDFYKSSSGMRAKLKNKTDTFCSY